MRGRGVAVGAMVVLSWCGVASAAAGAPVKVKLSLLHHRVLPGQPLKGTVQLTNTTKRTIVVKTCAMDGWLEVGLRGPHYTWENYSGLVACPPTVRLHPGVNRFPVAVATTYEWCQQPPQPPTPSHPACPAKGMPPLPAGRYHTVVSIFGLPHLTGRPNQISVALEAGTP